MVHNIKNMPKVMEKLKEYKNFREYGSALYIPLTGDEFSKFIAKLIIDLMGRISRSLIPPEADHENTMYYVSKRNYYQLNFPNSSKYFPENGITFALEVDALSGKLTLIPLFEGEY